jgi:hypothetical protein
MAYATVFHVEAENTGRGEYTKISHPTASQVIQYLEQRAAVLDGVLRAKGYLTPIATTATGAFQTLLNFNVLGAAYDVEKAAKTSDRVKDAQAAWEAALKMLQDGVIELDAPRDTTIALPRSSFSRSGDQATPFFTRDMEF